MPAACLALVDGLTHRRPPIISAGTALDFLRALAAGQNGGSALLKRLLQT